MMDLLNDISAWSVLKWVILVLIVGFIGQFGKATAQAIMGKIKLARGKKQDAGGLKLPPVDEKPASSASVAGAAEPPRMVYVETTDKKTLKTLAKQQKKALKKGTK